MFNNNITLLNFHSLQQIHYLEMIFQIDKTEKVQAGLNWLFPTLGRAYVCVSYLGVRVVLGGPEFRSLDSLYLPSLPADLERHTQINIRLKVLSATA